jgi:hypothetical protein
MLDAAEAFENAGKYRRATQILGQAYRKYRDDALKVRIIEAQARNYLRLPLGIDVAIGRLSEGAKIAGVPRLERPLKVADDYTVDPVTFAAAADMLQRYSARTVQASLPEFNIPATAAQRRPKPFLRESPDSTIRDVDLLVLPPAELRDRTRYDRVVTWNEEKGLSAYSIGSNTPLGTAAGIKSKPRGALWVGPDLLVWTAGELTLLKGDALSLGWSAPVRSLPTAEVVEGDPSVVRTDDAPSAGGNVEGRIIVVDGQVINLGIRGGGGGQFFINGVLQPAGAVALAPQRKANEAEEIIQVRPVADDRAIFGTSAGRVVAVDLGTGKIAWQTAVGAVPFAQMLANDDFIAVRFIDDSGSQIVALDTFAGQVVMRFTFAPGSVNAPLNMALSPDGTLVYSLPDRICGKDLYEPGKSLKFGDNPLSPNNRPFELAGGPDQLVVSQGRILALADQGQFVRVLSLEDGKEMRGQLQLSTSAPPPPNNWRVWMRVVGPRLYIFNQRTLTSYNLDRPSENWSPFVSATPQRAVRDAFIGKRHIVLLSQLADARGLMGQPADAPDRVPYYLLAYARYPSQPGRNDESGKLDQDPLVQHPAGIDQWQPVEGGFYYRSMDGVVHFLQGNTPAAAAKPLEVQ